MPILSTLHESTPIKPLPPPTGVTWFNGIGDEVISVPGVDDKKYVEVGVRVNASVGVYVIDGDFVGTCVNALVTVCVAVGRKVIVGIAVGLNGHPGDSY